MADVYIAEVRVPILLGDRERVMVFNANTMVAFEQATKKFYMDVIHKLYEIMFPEGHEAAGGGIKPVRLSGLDLVRKVPMEDLRALLWASLHEYDRDDTPSWPMTINQVGRQITFTNVVPVFVKFLTGVSANSPTKDELGESSAEPESATATRDGSAAPEAASGGGPGIRLPAGALA